MEELRFKTTLKCGGCEEKVAPGLNAIDEVEEWDVDLDSDESMNPKKLMTIWEEGFKSKYDQETTVNGKKVHQISLYPINPSEVNYHTIVLYIEAGNNDLQKAIMKTKDGSTMSYTINIFEKNKAVADNKFVYNPQSYPGYQLIRD